MKYTNFGKAALTLLISSAVLVSSGCNALSGVIKSGFDEVKNEIASEISAAGSEIASGLAEAQSELSSAMGEISSTVIEAETAVSSALNEAGSEVSDAFEDIEDNIFGNSTTTVKPADADITFDSETVTESIAETTDTTAAPTVEYHTFRNKKLYDDHYKKHGAEFGNITQQEYLDKANELIIDKSESILHKYSDDNDYLYFNTENNYFLVLSEDGYIRTFFIPSSGIKYWERQ